MITRKLRLAFGSLLLGFSAVTFAPAAHATIPEGAVVLDCTEVLPGYWEVTIFYQGQILGVFSDYCPLNP